MNQKFGKLIFVDNGSDLSTTLSSNFEIGKGSIDYVFHKFRWIFLGRVTRSHYKNFQKTFPQSLSQKTLGKVIKFN